METAKLRHSTPKGGVESLGIKSARKQRGSNLNGLELRFEDAAFYVQLMSPIKICHSIIKPYNYPTNWYCSQKKKQNLVYLSVLEGL